MTDLDLKRTVLDLPDCDIVYYPNFFQAKKALILFEKLRKEVPWQQDHITLFGKTHPQPRLTALFGNNGKSYSYSNITMNPHGFTPDLLHIKTAIEKETQANFTTCLLNLYRDGRDSNGWHADDEKELGQNPIIASVSLGAPRFFHLRHKHDRSLKYKMRLEHGSLLVMSGKTQHFWQHQIPKTSKKIGERINLTFRVIV
ncbi:alpha-ketoglutarate-dependent dioxygenase AlkB family protein [Flagellimonas meishanensis]|uniref:alpha-ketoglutarate-dependent dioxygenase AlkB family protein n=1 Tax=Flagellimonas meishanensis TaxID=2873264 RepID=UPI001CA64784|nr:alpha-ketoglutarate-dependent dioxygenase AlkB [[Muricauda] meishanensis]